MNGARVLRWARRRAGLTQRQLADKAGVPHSTVGRIEAGLTDPRLSTITRLLRACGIVLEPEDDLTDGIDRSLIREQLRKTPSQRVGELTQGARWLEELQKAAARSRARP